MVCGASTTLASLSATVTMPVVMPAGRLAVFNEIWRGIQTPTRLTQLVCVPAEVPIQETEEESLGESEPSPAL
jgi:hypothetical protein